MNSIAIVFLTCFSAVAGEKLELETSSSIQEVQTVREDYTHIRVVYSKVDVYPNLTVEIFTPGGEGTPLEIHASIHLKTPERPSNIKNLKLTPIALTYEILGTSCTYKIDSKVKGLLTKQANCQ